MRDGQENSQGIPHENQYVANKDKNCKHQCMFLPDGMTCGDCINIDWCSKVYGVKPRYTSCGFEPIKFKAKAEKWAEREALRQVNKK